MYSLHTICLLVSALMSSYRSSSRARSSTPMSPFNPADLNPAWHHAIQETDLIKEIMLKVFHNELKGGSGDIEIAPEVEELLPEILQAFRVCVIAFTHLGQYLILFLLCFYSVVSSVSGLVPGWLTRTRQSSKSKTLQISFPCTFVNEDGKIILWHLPGAISTCLQNKAVNAIEALLKEQPGILENQQSEAHSGLCSKVLFSYSGFAVSISFPGIWWILELSQYCLQMTQRPCNNCLQYLEVVIDFLKGMAPVMGIFSGIMFLTHPPQAARTRRTQRKFACDNINYVDEVLEILRWWSCPRQVIQLSVNQANGPHQRIWGSLKGYSLLSTFRAYLLWPPLFPFVHRLQFYFLLSSSFSYLSFIFVY